MSAPISMLALYTVALAAFAWLVAGLRTMVGHDDIDERRGALWDVAFASLVLAFAGWGVWGWVRRIAAAMGGEA